MINKIKKIASWTAVLLWMLLIFRLSSQVATESNDLSLGIAGLFHKLLSGFISINESAVNHIVRKGAHFTAYMFLGFLTSNALSTGGVTRWKKVIISLLICVLYAVSDEIHQLYVPGRSGQPSDVLIDSLGAGTGIGIYILVGSLFKWNKIKKS